MTTPAGPFARRGRAPRVPRPRRSGHPPRLLRSVLACAALVAGLAAAGTVAPPAGAVVPATYDLQANLQVARNHFVLGEPESVGFSVYNAGPAAAVHVQMWVEIPVQLTITGVTTSPDFSCTVEPSPGGSAPQTVTCYFFGVDPGGQPGAVVSVTPNTVASGLSIRATATSYSPPDEPVESDPTNNVVSAPIDVLPDVSDLRSTVTPSAVTMVVGEAATLEAQVDNLGPAFAEQVVLTVGVPANLSITAVDGGLGHCTTVGQVVTCTLASLSTSPLDPLHATITVLPVTVGNPVTATSSATFAGVDPDHTNDAGQATFVVSLTPRTPTTASLGTSTGSTVSGAPVTFTAQVQATPPATGAPAANVELWDDATLLARVPLVGGVATFTTTALVPGVHHVTARFAGGTTFEPSTSPTVPVTIARAGITIVLSSSQNPVGYRTPLTITASVTPDAPATTTPGTPIQFYDGTKLVGTAPIVAGAAVLPLPNLAAGAHPLRAVFPGGTRFDAATSNTVDQVVNRSATSTSLTVTPASTAFGQPLTMTVTVAATPPATGAPAANVTILDDGVPLATVPLAGGTATFATAALPRGVHQLSATFAGGQNFSGSTSPTVTRTVT